MVPRNESSLQETDKFQKQQAEQSMRDRGRRNPGVSQRLCQAECKPPTPHPQPPENSILNIRSKSTKQMKARCEWQVRCDEAAFPI